MKEEHEAAVESTVDSLVVSVEILRVLCDTTVRLTELRQRGCSHLCVENFAPECLGNLIRSYIHNAGIEFPERSGGKL